MKRRLVIALLFVVLAGCDGIEIRLDGPPVDDRRAPAVPIEYPTVNLPVALRQANWRGDEGEGSCVHASVISLFRWQGRYATAADLATDIRRHLADEPIIARPPSATYRIRKLIKRRRNLVGAYGLGIILVIAVAALLWWSGQKPTIPTEIRATRIAAEDFGPRDVFLSLSPDGRTVAYSEGLNLTAEIMLDMLERALNKE